MRLSIQRPLARLVDCHNIRATQAKVSAQRRALSILLAFDHNAHDPAPRTGWGDHQIKPVAVAMPPNAIHCPDAMPPPV